MASGTGAVAVAGCGRSACAATEHWRSAGTASSPWPLQTRLPLAALPTAPACARGHVRAVAMEWGLKDLADTAELLASELIVIRQRHGTRLRDFPP
jgi:hypothetical protein